MAVHFDFSGMLSGRSDSKHGLDSTDMDSISALFSTAREDLASRRKRGDLPFWDLPFDSENIKSVESFAAGARREFDSFVHLGIGGSALGPAALHAAINHPQYNLLPQARRGGCRFFCPDNVDPDYIGSVLDVIDPRTTLFNVVSKSGGTAETTAQFLLVLKILRVQLGESWRKNLVLTTDPEKGSLREFARQHGIRTFPIHPGVGGRFTVLSPVGLLPAAMTGIDIQALCDGAGAVSESCFDPELHRNPAAMFAALLYLAHSRRGMPIHVMFAYSNRLYPVADWFRQLWAESLGKKYDLDGKEVFQGPTPVKAVGATDQHSQVQLYVEGPADKVIIFLGTKNFGRSLEIPDPGVEGAGSEYLYGKDFGYLLNSEKEGTAFALSEAGRFNMQIELDRVDERHVGALMYLLEAATLYAGAFYNVNPLDQPGVEAGKKATYAIMGRRGYEEENQRIRRFFESKRIGLSIEV